MSSPRVRVRRPGRVRLPAFGVVGILLALIIGPGCGNDRQGGAQRREAAPVHAHGPACDHAPAAECAPVHAHGPACDHGPAAECAPVHAHGPACDHGPAAEAACAHGTAGGGACFHDHAGHAHGGGLSDLDRPVEELLGLRCEHAMPAFRCDDCRYEAGIARVPAALVEGGLVRVGRPVPAPLASELELSGLIEFDGRKVVELGSRASGVVRRVATDLGAAVAPGSLLAEIESADVGRAQAAYLEAQTAARVAARAYERQRELRLAGITSEREHLEAEQAHAAAAIRADLTRQDLARLGLSAAEIEALERAGAAGADGLLALRAPFAGEVVELSAVTGRQVAAGEPLARLADRRTLWVWVDLYETQLAVLGSAAEGSRPARVTVRALPGREFAGRLDFVGRVVDPGSRTVKARITLENAGGELRPGMFAAARVAIDAPRTALVLPSAAVLSDEGRDFVFVHCLEDYYLRRPVTRGRTTGEQVEVAGVGEEQQVVLEGAFLLKSDVLRAKMGVGCAH